MGDIRQCIRRLAAAAAGSSELDRMVGLCVVHLPHMKGPIHVFARIGAAKIPGFDTAEYPPYTQRLETAVALMELLLPGCQWSVEMEPTSGHVELFTGLDHQTKSTFKWFDRDSSSHIPIAMAMLGLRATSQIQERFAGASRSW